MRKQNSVLVQHVYWQIRIVNTASAWYELFNFLMKTAFVFNMILLFMTVDIFVRLKIRSGCRGYSHQTTKGMTFISCCLYIPWVTHRFSSQESIVNKTQVVNLSLEMLSLGILVLYIFQLKRRKGIISIVSCICRCLPKYIFCVHIFCCADIWLCIYFIVDKYHSEYILWWVCIIVAVSHRKLTLQVHPVIQNIDRQFCAARQMSCFHGALNWMNRLCYQRFAWGTAVDFLPLIKMHELQGVAKLHKVCRVFFVYRGWLLLLTCLLLFSFLGSSLDGKGPPHAFYATLVILIAQSGFSQV